MNTPHSSTSEHQKPKLLSCRRFFYRFVLSSLLLLSSLSAASAGQIFWVDWQDTVVEGGITKYRGNITVTRPDMSSSVVKVKFTPPGGIAFFQASGGIDYWAQRDPISGALLLRNPARSPYTSTVVDNIPTGTDIVALRYKGVNTLEFTDASGLAIQIASPIFAYVSLNGNGYGFDQNFDILSYGDPAAPQNNDIGYFGIGTSSKSLVTVDGATQYQLLGTGEPHGALQFTGEFSTVKWQSLSDEYWNGFTIGVPGLAVDIDLSPAIANPGGAVSYVENAVPVPVAPSLTVTDPDGPNLTGARVTITSGFVSGQDVLSFTSGAGITGSYNASSGVLSLSGSATAAAYQTVLRSVTYHNTSENPSGTPRTVTFSIGESTLFYSGNGHYYEFVSSAGITWSNARTAAADRQLFGLQGYMATITSAGENAFVASKLQGVGWIGGTDEASEGVWRWATGPEAGTQFWQGLAAGSTVGGQYANWNGGEPNNAGNEDYAHMIFNSTIGPVGSWNDLPLGGGGGAYAVAGYLVEYGGTPGDSTPQLTATALVNVIPVNDPPTISNISNQSVNAGGSTGPLVFTVGDFETPAGSLIVSASSSDQSVVPNGNIFLGGAGANRTVNATALNGACGSTTITVTVSDGLASAFDSFVVTVIDNQAPTVNCPQPFSVAADSNCSTAIPALAVTASDNCTPASQLVVTQIPAAGASVGLGNHVITVTVTDASGNSVQCQTTLSVLPGATFSYAVPDVFPGTEFLTCIIGNFQEPTRIQNWKLKLRSSATETVVLTVAATTVNTSETGAIEATVTDQTGLKTVTVVHPGTQTDNLGTLGLTLQGGTIYDLAIRRTGQAAHYKLGSPDKRLEIGFAYPLLYLEHHEQAWVVNAAPNENVSIDVLRDSPAIGGADPQATSMTYSVRRPDCTVVVPTTSIAVSGTISFSAGSTGGPFVIFMQPNGHFALRKNSGCDGGFYALPCPPKVQIACPANITKPNDPGLCGAAVTFAATATGICSPTVTYSKAPGSFFAIGITTVTATATDIFGETATCTFTVTVNDTEPPVAKCPPDFTQVNDPGRCGATVFYPKPTFSDNCAIADAKLEPPPGTFFNVGSTLVTATVIDTSGNVATCKFKVVVLDKEAPVVKCPPDFTQANDPGKCGAIVFYPKPTFSDNCAIDTVKLVPAPGTFFDVGSTPVTATVVDKAGNVATCTFNVIVVDKEAPTIVCPKDIKVSNDPGHCGALVKFEALAKDNCSAKVSYSQPPGTFFPVGVTAVVATAIDPAGNLAECKFMVTVVDTEAPKIATQASNQTVECDGSGNGATLNSWLASNGGAVAMDNCGSVTWSHSFTALSDGCGATGSATVTFTATDPSGNSSTTTATFTIVDTTAPKIDVAAANQTVECDGAGNAAALNAWLASNGGAKATDACGKVTWSNNFTSLSDLCGATGSATVTFTATDECGNTSATTATFTIVDTTAPVLTSNVRDILPKDAPITFTVSSQDICGNVTISLSVRSYAISGAGKEIDKSGSTVIKITGNQVTIVDSGGVGTIIEITATGTDDCGNKTTTKFVVKVLRPANEGVGNGVDGNTPGHDNNGGNDDPQFSPGNPGAKNKN